MIVLYKILTSSGPDHIRIIDRKAKKKALDHCQEYLNTFH